MEKLVNGYFDDQVLHVSLPGHSIAVFVSGAPNGSTLGHYFLPESEALW